MSDQAIAPAPTSRKVAKRDQQIKYFVRRLRKIAPHVDQPQFAVVLRGFAMITLTLERSYAALRDRDVMSTKTDELRSSIDTIGRLVGQQSKLAAALGLTPTVLGKLRKEKPVDFVSAMAAHAEAVENGDE